MRNLIIGILLGCSLTYSLTAIAADDVSIPKSGRLRDVTVEDMQGRKICEDPWYHADLKTVKCENAPR